MKPEVSAGRNGTSDKSNRWTARENMKPGESEEKYTERLQPAASAGKYGTGGEREKEAEAKSRLILVLHLIGGEEISFFLIG